MDKAAPLIKKAVERKLTLSDHYQLELAQYNCIQNSQLSMQKQNHSLIEELKVKCYYLDNDIYFSRREYQCLYWLANGKSTKEIGKLLNLSYRTVQAYVDNAKLKLGCTKTTEAIAVARIRGLDI